MRTGPERLALARKVAERRRAGRYFPEIADELGISPSYASMLYYDPDGSKERERKKKYAGRCELCGAATSGSNGRSGAPKRCATCAPVGRKFWTPERAIDAIQRFAAANGRPPIATDWLTADAENGYPAAATIYSPKGAPFKSWADAIEAAGFPRPRVGKRDGENHWDDPAQVLAAIVEASVDGVAPSASTRGVERIAAPARRFFGSWYDACLAAGVRARKGDVRLLRSWSADEVIREIRARAIDGYPPTASEDDCLRGAASTYFGSWTAAVKAAGFRPYRIHGAHSKRVKRRRELVAASRETPRSARRSRAASRSRAPA